MTKIRVSKEALIKALEDIGASSNRRIKGYYLWPDFLELEGTVVEEKCCVACECAHNVTDYEKTHCTKPTCLCHTKSEENNKELHRDGIAPPTPKKIELLNFVENEETDWRITELKYKINELITAWNNG